MCGCGARRVIASWKSAIVYWYITRVWGDSFRNVHKRVLVCSVTLANVGTPSFDPHARVFHNGGVDHNPTDSQQEE